MWLHCPLHFEGADHRWCRGDVLRGDTIVSFDSLPNQVMRYRTLCQPRVKSAAPWAKLAAIIFRCRWYPSTRVDGNYHSTPQSLVTNIMTPTETPEWKQIARNKRADQQQLIPKEWRLPSMEHLPKNALAYIRESSTLTPEELSITEITDARHLLNKIATGGLTAVQVLRAFCKRAAIAQQLVGCCTELMFDEALERAVLLDNHLATTGRVIGPLHGLPISFKDNIDVKGYDTTWGKDIGIRHWNKA